MEKDFEEFVVARCQTALMRDKEYILLKKRNHEPEEEADLEKMICYRQGFKDGMALAFKCSQKM